MLPITDPSHLHRLINLRDAAADGPYDLRTEWLSASGSSVLAQEAVSRIDPGQIERIVRASALCGISQYEVVSNDDPFVNPESMAFEVGANEIDLEACSEEFFGINMMLLAPHHGIALLSTVDDYSILAGPSAFILSYDPEIDRALDEFRLFAIHQVEDVRPAALRALGTFERFMPKRTSNAGEE